MPTISRRDEALLKVTLLHFLFLLLTFFLLGKLGLTTQSPNNVNLGNWDADWYYRIKTVGYYFIDGRQGTLAFFPLFPLLWKYSLLNEQGISLLNLFIYTASFFLIAKQLQLNARSALIFLSTPSLFFCFIPYSEALFFLGSTLLLIGFDKKNNWLIIAGIVLTCFTRSISMVFIAALLFTFVVAYRCRKNSIGFFVMLIGIVAAITFCVFWIQYNDTGQWLYFFKMQRLWYKELQWPTLPLYSASSELLWLDGLALAICIWAVTDAVRMLYKSLFVKADAYAASIVFSTGYLCLIGFLSVFYSGILPGQDGTTLMSLNRFLFATPFFIYFIYNKCGAGLTRWDYGILFGVVMVLSVLLGAWQRAPLIHKVPITIPLYFTAMALYISGFVIHRKKIVFVPLYLINCCAQLVLFSFFLNHDWVG